MDLSFLIESVYSGNSPTPELDASIIYNPMEITTKRFLANKSRYPIKLRDIFDPYVINESTGIKIFKRIRVVSEVVIDSEISLSNQNNSELLLRLIINHTKDTLVVGRPSSMSGMLFDNSYLTPLGILAFRYKYYFRNLDFKNYIRDTVLNVYYNDNSGYYILKAEYLKSLNIDYFDAIHTLDVIKKLPKWMQLSALQSIPFIFIWEEDLHER